MEAYFQDASFSGFIHSRSETPEQNFRRLRQSQEWPNAIYRVHRREFLEALLDRTNSPVHRYFITQHPDFLTYDSDVPARSEFERLRIFRNWIDGGLYDAARATFEEALQEELNSALEAVALEVEPSGVLEAVALEEEPSGALDNYYSSYPDFQYDPRQPPMMEFHRLMRHQQWGRRSRNYKQARTEFFEAFAEEFERYFGSDQVEITSWQQLCEDLGVEPIPVTITQCRKRLKPLHVNIYDLLHFKRTGAAFDIFPTVQALREYTHEKELIFPKARAKEGPLRFLLRAILWGGRANKRRVIRES